MVIEISEMRVAMDDWRGVTSPAEEKKRQNRLSQRAYRRRMKDQQGSAQCSDSAGTATSAAGPHSTHAPYQTRAKNVKWYPSKATCSPLVPGSRLPFRL